MKIALALLAAVVLLAGGRARAQSLEEQTRRPSGSSSLGDDSDSMRGGAPGAGTDSLDNGSIRDHGSMEMRGRAPDQAGDDGLDDGAVNDGDDDAD